MFLHPKGSENIHLFLFSLSSSPPSYSFLWFCFNCTYHTIFYRFTHLHINIYFLIVTLANLMSRSPQCYYTSVLFTQSMTSKKNFNLLVITCTLFSLVTMNQYILFILKFYYFPPIVKPAGTLQRITLGLLHVLEEFYFYFTWLWNTWSYLNCFLTLNITLTSHSNISLHILEVKAMGL